MTEPFQPGDLVFCVAACVHSARHLQYPVRGCAYTVRKVIHRPGKIDALCLEEIPDQTVEVEGQGLLRLVFRADIFRPARRHWKAFGVLQLAATGHLSLFARDPQP